MLIITRKVDESILIDGGIRIVIVAAEGGKVKLGIKAPKHIRIVREELMEEIRKENLLAGDISQLDIDSVDFEISEK